MKECPKCKEEWFSPFDKKYIDMFGNCYNCDLKKFKAGQMPVGVLKNREDRAQKATLAGSSSL